MSTYQNGSVDYPFTLSNMIGVSNRVLPGQTVNIIAGTCVGDYGMNFIGESASPITVKPVSSAQVGINGGVALNGSEWIIRDMEIFWDGWTTRESAQSTPSPSDISTKTLNGSGTNLKIINCVIHDLSSPFFGESMSGLEIYGCVIYHCGWSAPDRGHGHGIYVQNDTPAKYIKDCIIFDTFGWGIHAYTEGGHINNIWIEGNTCFRNGSLYGGGSANAPILVGGLVVAQNVTLKNNMTYGAKPNLGYYSGGGYSDATIENNYFPGGLTKIGNVQSVLSETGNYYDTAIGNQAFLRGNDYDSNRANLTIYNQASSNSISVDVSSVFSPGDSVNARNVQDYFVDVQNLTVAGDGTVIIDMQASNRTVSTPIQWTAPATTFPQFGCFVLEKV